MIIVKLFCITATLHNTCVLQGCLTVGKQILNSIGDYFIAVGFIFAAFVVCYWTSAVCLSVCLSVALYCMYSLTYNTSTTNHYEQFFQVGLLDRTLWCYLRFFKIKLTSRFLVEGLAWWDWPFTCWTDHLLSFSA